MKTVAVIVPSFEPGDYFEECLQSLENQTTDKSRFCVYIGLNGTRTPFEERISRWLENSTLRYRYAYIPEAGVSRARNELLDMSTEDFIVFVDDDDTISPNYLENLLAVSSEFFVGISNSANVNANSERLEGNFISKAFASMRQTEYSLFRARKYFSPPWAKMIHRSMIGDIRFDPKLKRGEDSLFMALASKNICGIKKAPADTYYYVRERPGSATRKTTHIGNELGGSVRLLRSYMTLLVKRNYNRPFVFSRIAATLLKVTLVFLGRAHGR